MSPRFWKHLLAVWLCAFALMAPLGVSARPWRVAAGPADMGAIAARIVELTNQTRAQGGLPPLVEVPYLAKAATGHSEEMLALKYFSHTSPTPGRTQPKMRIQRAFGWDTRIGENIYRSQGVPAAEIADRAMAAWIKSPSHYKNLMDPTFNSIGIGIVPSGDEFAITQNFSRQTIVVKSLQTTGSPAGYDLLFQGQVRADSKEGALFVNNAFKAQFTADANGFFELRASGPAGSQVSLSQKKPSSNSFAQNLAFPIEAGLAK